MRHLLGPTVLAALAAAPLAAAATLPTPPSLTTPTVSVPAVTVPSVTATTPAPILTTPTVATPTLTTPTLTAPQAGTQTATSPVAAVPAPRVTDAQPTAGREGAAPPAPVPAWTPPAARPAAAPPGSPAPAPARSRRLLTTARFELRRRTAVHVGVWQERDGCRFLGRYTFRGTRGANTLRLPRRVGRHALVVGAYRLVGVAAHRTVFDLRVRIVRAHGRLRVRRAARASACTAPASRAILVSEGLPTPSPGGRAGGGPTGPGGVRGSSHGERTASPPAAGPPVPRLVTRVVQAARQTLLYVLLALAIALLAGGALPARTASGGAAAALARHRPAVTSAGLALLAAAVLAAFLRS